MEGKVFDMIKNTFLHLEAPSLPRHPAPTHARSNSKGQSHISGGGEGREGPWEDDPNRHTPLGVSI